MSALGPRPAWADGGISTDDAAFLLELVRAIAPRFVLELGLGAGTSAAALLFALDQLTEGYSAFGIDARGELLSVDIRDTCYFDPSRQTGSAVDEMYPDHRAFWFRDTDPSGARRFGAARWAERFDLAFIDADHRHPWPLFDLLSLAPAMRSRPRAWVALHDIDLPNLYPEYAKEGSGAMWLFELWPFEKYRAPGPSSNIGAVRLPEHLGELVPMAMELLGRPWEAAPSADGLAPVFAPIELAAGRQARPAGRQGRT